MAYRTIFASNMFSRITKKRIICFISVCSIFTIFIHYIQFPCKYCLTPYSSIDTALTTQALVKLNELKFSSTFQNKESNTIPPSQIKKENSTSIKLRNDLPNHTFDVKNIAETKKMYAIIDKTVANYVGKFSPTNKGELNYLKKMLLKLNSVNDYRTKTYLEKRALELIANSDHEMKDFIENQKQRVKHITDMCKEKHSHLRKGASDIFEDSIHHLTMCPVYKSSSSTFIWFMLNLSGVKIEEHSVLNLQNLMIIFRTIFKSKRKTSDQFDYVHFIVVRHPFERLVSCFRNKIEFGNKLYYYNTIGEHVVRNYRQIPSNIKTTEVEDMLRIINYNLEHNLKQPNNTFTNPVGPTFKEFVTFVVNSPKSNEHWVPITTYCNLCGHRYDLILKSEHLATEGQQFLHYLKRENETLSMENKSKGKDTKDIACSYFNQLDLNLIKKLEYKYQLDFQLLGYDPTPYYACAHNNTVG